MSKNLPKLQLCKQVETLSKQLTLNTEKLTSLFITDKQRSFLRDENKIIEKQLQDKLTIITCMKGF
ncbi:hypothetical protein CP960_09715 [Malaciobacter halophilus]|uniref:Uncharacterized protein n=1 Tax=Malaciobacter halophilus TaxID=197482 RepID=A0A2N1J1I9_9BACT|nr:hypothetical protein [Malaciobacter halophilus]AXH09722.1 hypothetical protein AHALO_1350 [Malaciobacter halophilus]PKI80411.1 hypothetical protein CP960_09715 [Malaciobacter halophilus]